MDNSSIRNRAGLYPDVGHSLEPFRLHRMQKYNQTCCFLLVAAGIKWNEVFPTFGVINAYLDDHEYETDDDITDIFVTFDNITVQGQWDRFQSWLTTKPNLLAVYTNGEVLVVRFSLLSEWAHVKGELMSSKYSKIDREYVETFFYNDYPQGASCNYQILTRDPALKNQREKELGVSIPDDCELWEKLHMNREILNYNYEKFNSRPPRSI